MPSEACATKGNMTFIFVDNSLLALYNIFKKIFSEITEIKKFMDVCFMRRDVFPPLKYIKINEEKER